jgi:hypothetical protein
VPETRIEKGFFALGVLAIAALGFLVAHLWHHTRPVAAPPSTTTLSAPATTIATTQTVTSSTNTTATRSAVGTRTTTSADTRAATTTAAIAHSVSLLVTARTSTWLEIRSGSATGSLLFSGTLPAASSKTFRAKALWARFGAAGNLSARLDGKPLRLPAGTYDAMFDGHGFRPLGA